MQVVVERKIIDLTDEERVHLMEVAHSEYAFRYGTSYISDEVEFELHRNSSRISIWVLDVNNKLLFTLAWNRNRSGHLTRLKS